MAGQDEVRMVGGDRLFLRQRIEHVLAGHDIPRAGGLGEGYRLDVLAVDSVLVRWGRGRIFTAYEDWAGGLRRCTQLLVAAGLNAKLRTDGLAIIVKPEARRHCP